MIGVRTFFDGFGERLASAMFPTRHDSRIVDVTLVVRDVSSISAMVPSSLRHSPLGVSTLKQNVKMSLS